MEFKVVEKCGPFNGLCHQLAVGILRTLELSEFRYQLN